MRSTIKSLMDRRAISHRILLTLLTLSLVVEGILTTVPHQHPAPVAAPTVCDNPSCTAPSNSHIGRPESEASDHTCLACAIHFTSFGPCSSGQNHDLIGAVRTDVNTDEFRPALSPSWARPVRGPPAFA